MTTTTNVPTNLEKLMERAEQLEHAANKAQEAAVEATDLYMRQGGRAWSTNVDAALFNAQMTLRAAADRIQAIRAAAKSAQQ